MTPALLCLACNFGEVTQLLSASPRQSVSVGRRFSWGLWTFCKSCDGFHSGLSSQGGLFGQHSGNIDVAPPLEQRADAFPLQGRGWAGLLAAPLYDWGFPNLRFLSSGTNPWWAQHPPGHASQVAGEARGQGKQYEHGAPVACSAWSNKSFVFPRILVSSASIRAPGELTASRVKSQTPRDSWQFAACCWEGERPGCAWPLGRVYKWWWEHFHCAWMGASHSQALRIPTQGSRSAARPGPGLGIPSCLGSGVRDRLTGPGAGAPGGCPFSPS